MTQARYLIVYFRWSVALPLATDRGGTTPFLLHFSHKLGLTRTIIIIITILWDNFSWFILRNNPLGAPRRNGHPCIACYYLTLELEAPARFRSFGDQKDTLSDLAC